MVASTVVTVWAPLYIQQQDSEWWPLRWSLCEPGFTYSSRTLNGGLYGGRCVSLALHTAAGLWMLASTVVAVWAWLYIQQQDSECWPLRWSLCEPGFTDSSRTLNAGLYGGRCVSPALHTAAGLWMVASTVVAVWAWLYIQQQDSECWPLRWSLCEPGFTYSRRTLNGGLYSGRCVSLALHTAAGLWMVASTVVTVWAWLYIQQQDSEWWPLRWSLCEPGFTYSSRTLNGGLYGGRCVSLALHTAAGLWMVASTVVAVWAPLYIQQQDSEWWPLRWSLCEPGFTYSSRTLNGGLYGGRCVSPALHTAAGLWMVASTVVAVWAPLYIQQQDSEWWPLRWSLCEPRFTYSSRTLNGGLYGGRCVSLALHTAAGLWMVASKVVAVWAWLYIQPQDSEWWPLRWSLCEPGFTYSRRTLNGGLYGGRCVSLALHTAAGLWMVASTAVAVWAWLYIQPQDSEWWPLRWSLCEPGFTYSRRTLNGGLYGGRCVSLALHTAAGLWMVASTVVTVWAWLYIQQQDSEWWPLRWSLCEPGFTYSSRTLNGGLYGGRCVSLALHTAAGLWMVASTVVAVWAWLYIQPQDSEWWPLRWSLCEPGFTYSSRTLNGGLYGGRCVSLALHTAAGLWMVASTVVAVWAWLYIQPQDSEWWPLRWSLCEPGFTYSSRTLNGCLYGGHCVSLALHTAAGLWMVASTVVAVWAWLYIQPQDSEWWPLRWSLCEPGFTYSRRTLNGGLYGGRCVSLALHTAAGLWMVASTVVAVWAWLYIQQQDSEWWPLRWSLCEPGFTYSSRTLNALKHDRHVHHDMSSKTAHSSPTSLEESSKMWSTDSFHEISALFTNKPNLIIVFDAKQKIQQLDTF